MIRRYRSIHLIVNSLGLAAIFLGMTAAPALSAPSFGIQLTRDEAVVSHSDERVDYTVKVTNTVPAGSTPTPQVGETMTCIPGSWSGSPAFTYQWIRNGVALESAEDIAHGSQTQNYTLQAADAGEAVQCRIFGTNSVGKSVQTSIPLTVIDPQPAPAPPAAKTPISFLTRPQFNTPLFPSVGQTRECKAPTDAWIPSGLTWTLQWLINGQPIGSPTVGTTSSYQFQPGDEGKSFQCEATAEDANVKMVVISTIRTVLKEGFEVPGHPSNNSFPEAQFPAQVADDTTGLVTVELELPGGSQTYAHEMNGVGWSCKGVPAIGSSPAKAICNRSDPLKPQASYPSLKVVTALGADAPDRAAARATVAGGGAAAATAVDEFTFEPLIPFGLSLFETGLFDDEGNDYTQAGGHPFSGIGEFKFPLKRRLAPEDASVPRGPVANVKQVFTDLPRGVVGNALAVPELCPSTLDLGACPVGSIVGGIRLKLVTAEPSFPIYSLEPEFGTPAQFAFQDVFGNVYTLSARLRAEEGYAVSLDLAPSPEVELLESTATICGFGGKRSGAEFVGCKKSGEVGSNPKPLFSNPTRCEGPPPTVRVRLNSWENPDQFAESKFSTPAITGCDLVDFEPVMGLDPSSQQADSPTGLDIELTMPTEGLEQGTDCHEKQGDKSSPLVAECISQANLKRARIVFPEGMAINASAGHGLGTCSAEQVKLKTNLPHECPDSSKVATIEIDTPLIQETLKGAAYVAKQGDVGGALVGLYLVFESAKDGIIIKMPARVELNPKTGQLVTIVDESPEAPFSAVRMHFPGGPQATLLTPPKCGTYEIKAELAPWSAKDPDNPTPAETVVQTSSFDVSEGPNGGSCPTGALEPKMNAGTSKPVAGAHSPFTMRLHREDGSQRFSALSLTPPPGLVADLKGIPFCSDAALASISGEPSTGQAQIDSPSCPAASQIGTASAGAGAGPNPFFVDTGKAYLAGPYKGAPLSLALVTPAVAGPLDLGNVVVRTALYVNPRTARITAVSDPIPTILHGILLDVRDIRVAINRPGFTINPTNCEPMSVDATVTGAATATANLSNRFQVGGCENLGFKPRISLQLRGGTKRGDNPALTAVVRPRPGDANIGRASVTLPRSAFLDQAHIRTVCTRVQFAADQCPKGAIYGRAEAVTPLLDEPLEGAVYLRSSDNKLPDLVADLRGPARLPIKIEAAFRTDSIRGGIRSTLDLAPDAPVTKFTLQMQGGKKGLVVNSRDICAGTNRATARMVGQNGRQSNSRPKVVATNCGKQRQGKSQRIQHRR